MVIIRGSMPLITETRRGFESVPETEIQALPLTRPSLMSSVIAFHPTRLRAAREPHAIFPERNGRPARV